MAIVPAEELERVDRLEEDEVEPQVSSGDLRFVLTEKADRRRRGSALADVPRS